MATQPTHTLMATNSMSCMALLPSPVAVKNATGLGTRPDWTSTEPIPPSVLVLFFPSRLPFPYPVRSDPRLVSKHQITHVTSHLRLHGVSGNGEGSR